MLRTRLSLPALALAATLSACGQDDDATPDTDATTDSEVTVEGPLTGPRPVYRLSAEEIRRSVRDVLGVDLDTHPYLPEDALNRGFDVVDAASGLSPGFVDRMADLAAEIADRVLAPTIVVPGETPIVTFEAEHLRWDAGSFTVFYAKDVVWWLIDDEPRATTTFVAPEGGPWDVELVVTAQPGTDEPLDARLVLDQRKVADLFRLATGGERAPLALPETIDAGTIAPGEHELTMRLQILTSQPLDPWTPSEEIGHPAGPGIAIDRVVLYGPPTEDVVEPSPARARLITCEPDPDDADPCLRQILEPTLRRLWRREPTADEVDRLVALARAPMDRGGTLDDALRTALQAILISPSFLFRLDVDATTTDDDGRALQPYEVATRLAYTLWSAPPDDELLACAAAGGLDDTEDECGLRAQTARMLDAPAASALVDRFVAGWLRLTRVEGFYLIPWFYPYWAEPTPTSMQEEHRRLVTEFVTGDHDLRDLVVADHAWLDQALGNVYDEPVDGYGFRAVPTPGDDRSGILTEGLVLAAAGNGSSSPIRRAVWVATALLCIDLPKPPATVPPLPDIGLSTDPDDVIADHLANPTCAGCHAAFDGYGAVLGQYDIVGRRLRDAYGYPRSTTSTLPDGTVVRSAGELGRALRADPRLGRCMAEHMLIWALGEEVANDDPALDDLVTAAEAGGFTARALIEAVVTHPRFREASP